MTDFVTKNASSAEEETMSITDLCVDVKLVGGSGGSSFDNYKTDGSLISRIEAWADDNRMRGIKVYYSNSREGYDGSDTTETAVFGKEAGDYFDFTFEPGELVTKLSIWSTKWDGDYYVGAFKMETSLGNEFYPKENSSSHEEYEIEVGYGALVGLTGKCGNALDKLGFYLVKEPKSVVLSEVEYSSEYLPEPTNNDLTDITYTNNTSLEQSYEFEYSYTEYEAYTWETNSGFEESYSLSISAEVPEVTLGAEATASWTYSYETTSSAEYSSSKQVTASYPVNVPAYTTMTLNMSYYSGDCKMQYTGVAELTFSDGNFSYYTYGAYTGGNTTDIVVTLTETPIDESGEATGSSTTSTFVQE